MTPVAVLLTERCPSAVARLVVPVRVTTIESEAFTGKEIRGLHR